MRGVAWGISLVVTWLLVIASTPQVLAEIREPSSSILHQISQLNLTASQASQWRELLSTRSAYLNELATTLALSASLLEDGAAMAIKKRRLPESEPGINLWAGYDQETGFSPSIHIVNFHKGGNSRNTGPLELKERIPPRFRLAEQLGLGTNSFQLHTQFIDPRFQSRNTYGFAVGARILHELKGQFWWGENSELTTICFQIESRSRYEAAHANFGTGVKPHQLGIASMKIEDVYNRNSRRAWDFEQLSKRILTEGREIIPSQNENDHRNELNDSLQGLIATSLTQLRTAATQYANEKLQTSGEWRRFVKVNKRIRSALGVELESPERASDFELWSSIDVREWIVDHVEPPPWTVESAIENQSQVSTILILQALAKQAGATPPHPDLSQTLDAVSAMLKTIWGAHNDQ